jgi:peroxiredoxin (alkyl hydroperoxide reductase subunit C)
MRKVLELSPLWFAPVLLLLATPSLASAGSFQSGQIYDPGRLKPVDSTLKVAVGDPAPDFTLPSVSGPDVTLSQFRGKKNVVISFVPAAWTPVCSDQWPGYNITRELFEQRDAVLLGISVDNIPTLHAWTGQMGQLWFPVLSDFWPHGAVADRFGVLRSDGTAERAILVIDKKGILRTAIVSEINVRPKLEEIVGALDRVVADTP